MTNAEHLPNYPGPDRRVHRMYVTRNTEYHFRQRRCVGVRDRRSGSWLPSHLALERELTGAVQVRAGGVAIPRPDTPRVGEALYFGGEGRELVTSLLCAIERPPKSDVERYRSA